MELKIKNVTVSIAFNYLMMFKVDKQLATRNPQTGASNNDGVGALFLAILNQEDEGLLNLIKLALPKSKNSISDDDIIEAIGEHVASLVDEGLDEEAAYSRLFDDVKAEMVDSGFFKTKISKYIDNMERARTMLSGRTDMEDLGIQLQSLDETIGMMKNALS